MYCMLRTLHVLIAPAVYLLERGHTDRPTHKVTDAADRTTHASATAGLQGKTIILSIVQTATVRFVVDLL